MLSDLSGLTRQNVGLVGVPFDTQSSFLRGSAAGPAAIRDVWADGSINYSTELLTELDQNHLLDLGDMDVVDGQQEITTQMMACLESGAKFLSLGGDHSITYWLIQAYAQRYPGLTIIQFDAHPDLYEHYQGNRYSHACPFARIMEDQLAERLVQIGIRAMNVHQKEQALKYGVEQYTMSDLHRIQELQFEGPVYISFDLDALDPAFVPGVSHYEPGGLSTREALNILHGLEVDLVGADIVECNPTRDHHGMTAMVACKLIKELTGMMLS